MTLRTSRNQSRSIWSKHRTAFERVILASVALFVAGCLFAIESRAIVSSHELRVWFLDVGQGDATFIEMPTGEQILIDGGPDRAVLAKLGEIMLPWDRTIDAVIATHQDSDHVGGLASVLERYEVGQVVTNNDQKDTSTASAFFAARDTEPGAVVESGRRGDSLRFGDVTLTELSPNDEDVADEDANAGSIVYRLDYGDTSILLIGDAPETIEQKIAESVGDVDVLKAGHHGSSMSSSYAFLQSVRPESAVLSCGQGNRYGHPHPATLKRFLDLRISVLRTDEDGDILLTSGGGEPKIRPAPLPF